MVALQQNATDTSAISYFLGELDHSRCSDPKSKGHRELHVAIYAEGDQLESCSRDPIGYTIFSFNHFEMIGGRVVSFVDPTGLLRRPIGCVGAIEEVQGHDWCVVTCGCPDFSRLSFDIAPMPREISPEEWADWGFPEAWPGTRQQQCDERADEWEEREICPDNGGGGNHPTPVGLPGAGFGGNHGIHNMDGVFEGALSACFWLVRGVPGMIGRECIRRITGSGGNPVPGNPGNRPTVRPTYNPSYHHVLPRKAA